MSIELLEEQLKEALEDQKNFKIKVARTKRKGLLDLCPTEMKR